MRNKIISSLAIGLSLTAFGQAALADDFVCDSLPANIIGTDGPDTIVVNDDGTYSLNGGAPVGFTPPAVVYGGNGNDQISGSSFDDVICGNNGDDTIEGGDGSDSIFGQNGIDKLYGDSSDLACIPAFATDPDGIPGSGDETPAITCDDEVVGGNGNDIIEGGNGSDSVIGQNGKDKLYGDSNNIACVPTLATDPDGIPGNGDETPGLSCDDEVLGGNAPDTLDGGFGADSLGGGNGKDTCTADALEADTFAGCEVTP